MVLHAQLPLAIEKVQDYRPAAVDLGLARLIRNLGGLEQWVQGKSVLIKPNFLVPKAAAKAVTTHPVVIRSLAQAVVAANAKRVIIADSPAVTPAKWVAQKLDLPRLLRPLPVVIENLTDVVSLERPDLPYRKIELARQVVQADVVINLAKLKTHSLCGMTMAVKNCFGAVVGMEKTRWHLRAGRDQAIFSSMIVEVCRAVAPVLSIVDAIDAMDGNGPNNGRVRRLGFLAGCQDPFVLDRVLARILGLSASQVSTFAFDGQPNLDSVAFRGAAPDSIAVSDWQMSVPAPGLAKRFLTQILPDQFFRQRLSPPPRLNLRLCDTCKQCVRICPSHAIRLSEEQIKIDPKNCIRCFCCQEICPTGALHRKRTWFG